MAEMTEMQNRCSRYAPATCFIMAAVVFHLSVDWFTGDFRAYRDAVNNPGFMSFLVSHYEGWSSRTLIEAVLIFFCNVPHVWFLIDVLIMYSIYNSLDSIFNPGRLAERSWIIVFILLVYPADVLLSAGVIPTTINYIWPLAGLLYYSALEFKELQGQSVSKAEYVLVTATLIFSVNMELCAALSFLMGVAWFVLFKQAGKSTKMARIQILVSIVGLLYFLTCPGNKARLLYETDYWLPVFSEFSLLEKAYLGFVSTFNYYLFSYNALFLSFLIALSIVCWSLDGTCFLRALNQIPLLAYLAALLLKPFFENHLPLFGRLFYPLDLANGQRGAISPMVQVSILLLIVNALITVYRNETTKGVLFGTAFLGGLGTRVVMGFSPTLFASGERTFLFFDMALAAITLDLTIQRVKDERIRLSMVGLFAAIALLAVVGTAARL